MSKTIIPLERIENKIYVIRGIKVMLDRDLAELYGVDTRQLNQAVKRNLLRFPDDFMFNLTREEIQRISQNVISLKFSKNVNVFTEQGIAMLSGVLNSERAILVNITIMRAFVKLRELMMTHKDLARKIEELEKKYDSQFQVVFEAIRQLMSAPPEPVKKKIGFHGE